MLDANAVIIILFGILIATRTYTVSTQRVVGFVLMIVGVLLSIGSLTINL